MPAPPFIDYVICPDGSTGIGNCDNSSSMPILVLDEPRYAVDQLSILCPDGTYQSDCSGHEAQILPPPPPQEFFPTDMLSILCPDGTYQSDCTNHQFVKPIYDDGHPPALPLVPLPETHEEISNVIISTAAETPPNQTFPNKVAPNWIATLTEQLRKKEELNKAHNCKKCENYNESRGVCEPIPDCMGFTPELLIPELKPEGTPILSKKEHKQIDTKKLAIAIGVGFAVWYLLNIKND